MRGVDDGEDTSLTLTLSNHLTTATPTHQTRAFTTASTRFLILADVYALTKILHTHNR
jgi:hypothetical protein